MSDDYEFIGNVKTLAVNGTLIELLRRVEEDCVSLWSSSQDPKQRECCWHDLQSVRALHAKIESFSNEEKVREWLTRRAARRS